jgi:hypothetical protein
MTFAGLKARRYVRRWTAPTSTVAGLKGWSRRLRLEVGRIGHRALPAELGRGV